MKFITEKKVGKLGRLGIPEDVRDRLNMPPGTPVEIYEDGDRMIVQRYRAENRCTLCGSTDNLFGFRGQSVCEQCRDDIVKPTAHE